jgi:hypothetical protein
VKKLPVVCCVLANALWLSVSASQDKLLDKPVDLSARARSFVDFLSKSQFADATKYYDSAMLKALPEDKLQETWKSLITQYGSFKKHTTARQEARGKYQVVHVTCEFEKQPLEARVVFDKDDKITGLFFGPPASAYQAPPYVRRSTIQESDAMVGSGEWMLPGTLTMPTGAGPFPWGRSGPRFRA